MAYLLRRAVDDASRLALLLPGSTGFEGRRWGELADDVWKYAGWLARCGVRCGDRVAQVSENRYEWLLSDLAILALGAVHVPLHTSLSTAQLVDQLAHSQPRLVLASPATQPLVTAALQQRARPDGSSPAIELQINTAARQAGEAAAELRQQGRDLAAQTIARDDHPTLATILYTSGALGEPRGVMLSHGNLIADTVGILQAFGENPCERRLCFLPLSHIYARTCDLYVWLVAGTEMVLAASPASVLSTAQETHPTFINGVPFFYERLVAGLAESLRDRGGHRSPGILRAALGQQIEQCSCGGAAVSAELVDYFQEQQVHLLPGYGLSEAAPVVTASTPRQSRRGTVGRPLPNVEVRIAADGEILVRGPQVMLGYYRDEQQTSVVTRDGWLHTGDIGELDEAGYLTISGRRKEIIATKQGKKIPPLPLEAQLAALTLIDQVMVIGDERDYLIALVVPDLSAAAALFGGAADSSADSSLTAAEWSLEQACCRVELQQAIAAQIATAQRPAARHERIRKVALVADRFTVENGLLTSKLTLRRALIAARHAPAIEAMYANDRAVSAWLEIPSCE